MSITFEEAAVAFAQQMLRAQMAEAKVVELQAKIAELEKKVANSNSAK